MAACGTMCEDHKFETHKKSLFFPRSSKNLIKLFTAVYKALVVSIKWWTEAAAA